MKNQEEEAFDDGCISKKKKMDAIAELLSLSAPKVKVLTSSTDNHWNWKLTI